MAALAPFRALRPTSAAAKDVAAVPYDVVTADEAAVLAHGNPLELSACVARRNRSPSGELTHTPTSCTDKAARSFHTLRRDAPLVLEDTPALYVYRLRMGRHEQTGVAGCFSLDEYGRDVIKKHERTRRDKEDDRTRHMLAIGAQTGPVFLTYRSVGGVAGIVQRATATQPLFDFVAPDGVQHVVWKMPPEATHGLQDAFGAVPALYIADGHHRAASAARAREQLGSHKGPGEWDTFLGVAFPDDQVQILAYNRIVKDLAGASPASLLSAAAREVCRGGWDGRACPPRGSLDVFGRRVVHHWNGQRTGDADRPPSGLT